MTETMFHTLLGKAEATSSKTAPATLPDGRSLTLYISNNSASMTCSKVVSIRHLDGVVEAVNKKGELFLFALGDIYGACLHSEGEAGLARKAGFLDR